MLGMDWIVILALKQKTVQRTYGGLVSLDLVEMIFYCNFKELAVLIYCSKGLAVYFIFEAFWERHCLLGFGNEFLHIFFFFWFIFAFPGEVAKLFADAGVICIASLISPYRRDRDACRALLPDGDFIEVASSQSFDYLWSVSFMCFIIYWNLQNIKGGLSRNFVIQYDALAAEMS